MQATEKRAKLLKWRTHQYVILCPDGNLRQMDCPALFDVSDIAAKASHHDFFYSIRRNGAWNLMVREGAAVHCLNHGVAVWSRKAKEWRYVGESLPRDEREAIQMLKSVGVY